MQQEVPSQKWHLNHMRCVFNIETIRIEWKTWAFIRMAGICNDVGIPSNWKDASRIS